MAITTAKDRLATLVDELSSSLNTTFGLVLTQQQLIELKRVSGVWLDSTQTKVLSLADNKPDYNQLLLQFQNMLEHEDGWRDTITAGAGQSLLRFISAAVAATVFAQERAVQERFPDTARLASSIFASTRSQGVRIVRRTPAKVPVMMTRAGSEYLMVPRFTTFTLGDTKFFNRTPIVFGNGDVFPVEVELFQGEVFEDTYNSPGQPFTTYEVGNQDGAISEDDVYLFVDEEEYTRVTTAFFDASPNDKVFYENTLPNGNVEVITGSGNYGVMPPSNSIVRIKYVTTAGTDAHSNIVEQVVSSTDYPQIVGTSAGAIYGATMPDTVEFYRINAPYIRSSQERAVVRRDYEVQALRYPSIKILDARIIGQQDFAPNEKWAQGVIKASVLTAVTMDDPQWSKFSAYLQDKAIEGFVIVRADPTPKDIDISVRIGINPAYALEAARLAARSAIVKGYAPVQGSLGREFYRYDISTLLLKSTDPALKDGINWIEIDSPTDANITLAWNEYINITSLTVTTEYSNRAYSNRVGFNQSTV